MAFGALRTKICEVRWLLYRREVGVSRDLGAFSCVFER